MSTIPEMDDFMPTSVLKIIPVCHPGINSDYSIRIKLAVTGMTHFPELDFRNWDV